MMMHTNVMQLSSFCHLYAHWRFKHTSTRIHKGVEMYMRLSFGTHDKIRVCLQRVMRQINFGNNCFVSITLLRLRFFFFL